jgi:hypothetical protein
MGVKSQYRQLEKKFHSWKYRMRQTSLENSFLPIEGKEMGLDWMVIFDGTHFRIVVEGYLVKSYSDLSLRKFYRAVESACNLYLDTMAQ